MLEKELFELNKSLDREKNKLKMILSIKARIEILEASKKTAGFFDLLDQDSHQHESEEKIYSELLPFLTFAQQSRWSENLKNLSYTDAEVWVNWTKSFFVENGANVLPKNKLLGVLVDEVFSSLHRNIKKHEVRVVLSNQAHRQRVKQILRGTFEAMASVRTRLILYRSIYRTEGCEKRPIFNALASMESLVGELTVCQASGTYRAGQEEVSEFLKKLNILWARFIDVSKNLEEKMGLIEKIKKEIRYIYRLIRAAILKIASSKAAAFPLETSSLHGFASESKEEFLAFSSSLFAAQNRTTVFCRDKKIDMFEKRGEKIWKEQ